MDFSQNIIRVKSLGAEKGVLSVHHWSQITGSIENDVFLEHHWSQVTGGTENRVVSVQHWSQITRGTENSVLSEYHWSQIRGETENGFHLNSNAVKSQGAQYSVLSDHH